MPAIPYARLLTRVLALAGTNAGTTDSTDLAQIGSLLNGRFRQYFEHYWWPETMLCEVRPYRPAYAAGTTYAEGDEVYYATTGLYYTAVGATTGNAPSNGAYWTLLTSIDPAEVPYTATGLTSIGLVRQVSATDPQGPTGARRLPFALTGTGVRVLGDAVPTLPWVWYQKRAPDLYGATYSAVATYAAGDMIYFASGTGTYEGDYWLCLSAPSAAQTPLTHAAKWARQEVPDFLLDPVAYGTAADLYRAGGKTDLAPYLEDKAETTLIGEQSKVMAMQAQTASSRRSADYPPSLAPTI